MKVKEKQEFFKYLKTLPDFKKMLIDYQPEIVYLGGSRATGCEKSDSDYDIIVRAGYDYPGNFLNSYRIHNDRNLSIHCLITSMYQSIAMILDDYSVAADIYTLASLGWDWKIKDENIIYQSLKIKQVQKKFSFCQKDQKQFLELCIYNYMLKLRDELNVIFKTKILDLNPKIYYHLIFYYDLLYEDDNSAIIKKIREHRNLTTVEQNKFNLIFKTLFLFYNNFNDYEYIEIKRKLEVIKHEFKNSY